MNVFILEDSPVQLQLLKGIVRSVCPSCVIFEATNLKDATKIVKSVNFNVAFLDFNAPEPICDVHLCNFFNFGCDVIVVTADNIHEILSKTCHSCRLVSYMQKPFDSLSIKKILDVHIKMEEQATAWCKKH